MNDVSSRAFVAALRSVCRGRDLLLPTHAVAAVNRGCLGFKTSLVRVTSDGSTGVERERALRQRDAVKEVELLFSGSKVPNIARFVFLQRRCGRKREWVLVSPVGLAPARIGGVVHRSSLF